MTSGGYRSVTPAETVARFRKHVSPLTGVVSQLERLKSEQAPDIGFLARYGFSPRPEALDAPQARLIADSYGKGTTADECEASALMQAIERHCGIFRGDEIRTTRTFVDFPAGDAIPPNDILLLSDAQYEHGLNGAAQGRVRGFDASAGDSLPLEDKSPPSKEAKQRKVAAAAKARRRERRGERRARGSTTRKRR